MNWDTNLKNMWYIYILECSDGTYYCGITNNFHKRMDDHNSGKGAKYTRKQKEELIKYKVYPEYIFNYCDNLYYMKDEKLYIWGLVGEEEKEEWIEFVSEEMKKIYLRNKKLKRILK
jgi:hypothetical protein